MMGAATACRLKPVKREQHGGRRPRVSTMTSEVKGDPVISPLLGIVFLMDMVTAPGQLHHLLWQAH